MTHGRVDVWKKLLGGADESDVVLPYDPKAMEELQRLQDEAKTKALPPIPTQPLAG